MIVTLLTALVLQSAPPPAAMVPPWDDRIGIAAQQGADEAAATLDRMHQAAADADGETYFAQFSDGARFVGTDASEHWDISAFKAYAEPIFTRGQGWTYRPYDRTLIISGDVAWFDEKLDNDSYGALRGSGLLRRTGPGEVWKIEQYVLSFTVPNDKAKAVVDVIKSAAAD
ncbi:nuclear transport factor 2 family protein [Brevundimonas sp. SL130]|uniref:nuclear transport factor 2 family protein n=1 Tax=Brevundimonas sp. SL130 TaxID=2995143 RepID=UPI00226D1B97|nr:nuclear transport factor 2 family protein [Brevundimonas sp. SL130]WAC58364.1 nuclear transport factor 2 family protein [Brevundimonas sp. SL130]